MDRHFRFEQDTEDVRFEKKGKGPRAWNWRSRPGSRLQAVPLTKRLDELGHFPCCISSHTGGQCCGPLTRLCRGSHELRGTTCQREVLA